MSALQLAQLDATGRTVTAIVFGLLVVAAALALLTAWYWRVTDPRRTRQSREPGPPRRPPGGNAQAVDDPDTDGAAVVLHPQTAVAGQNPEDTAVLDRRVTLEDGGTEPISEPLDPSAHRPVPRDRRDVRSPAPASPERLGPTAAPAVEEVEDELVIDLRDDHDTAPPEDDGDGRSDEKSLSFEEWLALAEEDS